MPSVQSSPELHDDIAELATRRFKALLLLMRMYKGVKGQRAYKLNDLQALLELPTGGLSQFIFKYYCLENPVSRASRKVHHKKLVCHIIVLALDLSVGYKLDFAPCIEELGMTIDEMQENVRYCGCECSRGKSDDNVLSTGSSRITLITELKAPLTFQAPKGAGRG